MIYLACFRRKDGFHRLVGSRGSPSEQVKWETALATNERRNETKEGREGKRVVLFVLVVIHYVVHTFLVITISF